MTSDDEPISLTRCYEELRQLARSRLGKLPPGQTLQATALVHEAWVRLESRGRSGLDDRRQFFQVASQAMRDILVEAARRRSRIKRGGDCGVDERDPDDIAEGDRLQFNLPVEDILTLHELLDELRSVHPRPAEIVLLKWFSGLEHEEIAEILEISIRTVERDWRFAKVWLYERLETTRGSTDG